ncbi:MAG: hypothetical protein J7L88_05100 [Thermoplasmata archaeon]|nr:hypothetical protein [Thermoplasmata archaeon]
MLETYLKWFTLIAVSLVAVSPLLYILSERMSDVEVEEAREVLNMIKEVIETAFSEQGETHVVLRWGEDLPRSLRGGDVVIMAYPGYLKLLSAGRTLAAVSVRSFYTYPSPFLHIMASEDDLTGAQWHLPPLRLDPSEPVIISSVRVGDRMEVCLSTPLSELFAPLSFFNTFGLVTGRETILQKGGEVHFQAKRDLIVGRGYVIESWRVGGKVYHCVQWTPIEALYGQVRNKVMEVEYLRMEKGDVATLTISSGLYTITVAKSGSTGPTPE